MSSGDTTYYSAMLNLKELKRLRLAKGLSMEKASDAAGLSSRQHWFQIETGQRADIRLSTLDKIASALGVRAKDLLK